MFLGVKRGIEIFLKKKKRKEKKSSESYVISTDIQGKSQTWYTAPCNGVVSHGDQIGGIRVFADNTRNTSAKQMRPRSSRAMQHYNAYLSSRSDCSRSMQVTYAPDEPRLFWLREKPEDPQFEPLCLDENGAGSGIFLVYLWSFLRSLFI